MLFFLRLISSISLTSGIAFLLIGALDCLEAIKTGPTIRGKMLLAQFFTNLSVSFGLFALDQLMYAHWEEVCIWAFFSLFALCEVRYCESVIKRDLARVRI